MPQARLTAPLLAMTAALALGGCATTSSDPTALIPADVRASVIAEDRMASGSISVNEMLSRARDGEAGSAAPAPAGDGAQAGVAAANTAASGAPPTVPTATPARSTMPPPEPPEPKAFFEVTFDGTEDQPSVAAKEALARKLKSARLSAKTEVTILSGPGPGTTAFDQALLANRRARAVRSLLPEGWKATQVYNPDFPPDTVRIVLGSAT